MYIRASYGGRRDCAPLLYMRKIQRRIVNVLWVDLMVQKIERYSAVFGIRVNRSRRETLKTNNTNVIKRA